MIELKDLLKGISALTIINDKSIVPINKIEFDSRKVENGDLFVATKGSQSDGHDYIDKAIEKGALVIVCENIPKKTKENICYIEVANSAKVLGHLASNYYDNPSQNLIVIGVTGTNGKTSTCTMLFDLFMKLGYKAGLLSTIKIQIVEETVPATHTTPDAVSIQKSMKTMVEKGCTYCFMEVSSHAIDQDRIAGINFRGGVFMNITHDHLDYHKTFQNYIQAKKKFFDNLGKASFALTNADDKNGKVMIQNTKAEVKSFAMNSMADYRIKILEASMDAMVVHIQDAELVLRLAGEFNAYNALASYAVASELDIKKSDILLQMSKLESVEGRIDIVQIEHTNVKAVVDYAHTPDAVDKVLSTISKVNKNGKLITVVGCGGDRDKDKRPLMAQLAAKYSHRLILTSDNPRTENPVSIIEDMKLGLIDSDLKKTLVVVDREEAIKTACLLAENEDIIAVLGKGHEKYQDTNGVKAHFDDKEMLLKYLELSGN